MRLMVDYHSKPAASGLFFFLTFCLWLACTECSPIDDSVCVSVCVCVILLKTLEFLLCTLHVTIKMLLHLQVGRV